MTAADPRSVLLTFSSQLDDHFYYWLLYDRFTQTTYDILPTTHVRHLPPKFNRLIRPFQYALSLCHPDVS